MDILRAHELLEIEVLEKLNSAKFLDFLVFGGGTMLRLCYELNRYSADLDFWFIKKLGKKGISVFFDNLYQFLETEYELTDSQSKHYTLLFEIRSKNYPKRLKIEIRKEEKKCDYQERIAYSHFASKQVILKTHTLEQVMKNKIEAALDRSAIRDFFDLEFLLRKGIELNTSRENLLELGKLAKKFKEKDYKTTLGSVLDPKIREYYIKNHFNYLIDKIKEQIF